MNGSDSTPTQKVDGPIVMQTAITWDKRTTFVDGHVVITPYGLSNQIKGVTSIAYYPDPRVWKSDKPILKCQTDLGAKFHAAMNMFGDNGMRAWLVSIFRDEPAKNGHPVYSPELIITIISPEQPTPDEVSHYSKLVMGEVDLLGEAFTALVLLEFGSVIYVSQAVDMLKMYGTGFGLVPYVNMTDLIRKKRT